MIFSFYGSSSDIEQIFKVDDKMSTTNMEFPPKECGWVGQKTFTSKKLVL